LFLHGLSNSERADTDSDPDREGGCGGKILQPAKYSVGVGIERHESEQHEQTLETYCHPGDAESGDTSEHLRRLAFER